MPDFVVPAAIVIIALFVLSLAALSQGRPPVHPEQWREQTPMGVTSEPLAIETYVAPALRVPPYTGVEDEGYTEPIRTWEQPSGRTYFSRSRLP